MRVWCQAYSKFVYTCCKIFAVQSDCRTANLRIPNLTLHVRVYFLNWSSGVATPTSRKQCVCDYIPAEQTLNRHDTRPSCFALVGMATPDYVESDLALVKCREVTVKKKHVETLQYPVTRVHKSAWLHD